MDHGRRQASFLALLFSGLVLASCEVSHVPPAPARPNKVVLGYYVSSKKAEFDHTKIAYKNLTHIAHAFAWPDSSGNLVVPAGFLYPALNAAAHASGVKMIVSLGGWGNCGGFPGMSSTAANRARFIGQLVDFCEVPTPTTASTSTGSLSLTPKRRRISSCSSKRSGPPSRPRRRPCS